MTMTIDPLLRQPAAQALAWALLQFVWQGALVGGVTAAALVALRRAAADVRYLVATIGMALMLTLPVVTGVQRYQALPASSTPVSDADSRDLARVSRQSKNQDPTPVPTRPKSAREATAPGGA